MITLLSLVILDWQFNVEELEYLKEEDQYSVQRVMRLFDSKAFNTHVSKVGKVSTVDNLRKRYKMRTDAESHAGRKTHHKWMWPQFIADLFREFSGLGHTWKKPSCASHIIIKDEPLTPPPFQSQISDDIIKDLKDEPLSSRVPLPPFQPHGNFDLGVYFNLPHAELHNICANATVHHPLNRFGIFGGKNPKRWLDKVLLSFSPHSNPNLPLSDAFLSSCVCRNR